MKVFQFDPIEMKWWELLITRTINFALGVCIGILIARAFM